MKSQFDFLKEYSEFSRHHKHFIRAEEYLYESPQDTCNQLTISIERFAKELCSKRKIQLDSSAGASRAINELCYRKIIDFELQRYACFVITSRNESLHNDIDNLEVAKKCLQNGYLFFKKYIQKYIDPAVTIGGYIIPSASEIRNRKIETLRVSNAFELTKELKTLEEECKSVNNYAREKENENETLRRKLEIEEHKHSETKAYSENNIREHQILISKKNDEIKEKELELIKKEEIIAHQRDKIKELDTIIASRLEADRKFKSKITEIVSKGYTYLDELNKEQKKAVLETDGYVRVLAGPGTGKTKTLAHRFVHLVVSKQIKPENILCLTFTNKAAKEMKNRISKWLGFCDLSQVCTFHAFCYRIVSENASEIHFRNDFIIIDTDDKEGIIEAICEKMSIDTTDKRFSLAKLKNTLDKFKINDQRRFLNLLFGCPLETIEAEIKTAKTIYEEVYLRFIFEQRRMSLLEFEDLFSATSYLFYIKPEIMDFWQNKIQYIMVDEYQDVNYRQAKMCECLAKIHKNLFVVGDPNQTIYSWRNSDVRFINHFPVKNTEKDIMLVENYRSTPEILNAAKRLIEKQSKFVFQSNKESGLTPIVYGAGKRSDETRWIVDKMETLVKQSVPRNEIAVLFRNSYSSQRIELELLERHLPYRVVGGNAFYNSKEVKVIHSYLQLIAYDNDFAFKKVIGKPSRGIGGKTINKLFDIKETKSTSLFGALKYATEHDGDDIFPTDGSKEKAKEFVEFIASLRGKIQEINLLSVIAEVIERSGYASSLSDSNDDDGLRNIVELLKTVREKEKEFESTENRSYTMRDYLNDMATYSSTDNESSQDSFVLSTIHGAKGLEYQYVIVCGLEENSFPRAFKYSNGSIETENDFLNEERRLCFVALTRAKKGVFLTFASSENGNKSDDILQPSRFINDILATTSID